MSFVVDWVNGDVADGYMLANWVVERDVITLNADGKIINVSTKAGFWTLRCPTCLQLHAQVVGVSLSHSKTSWDYHRCGAPCPELTFADIDM